VRALTCKTWRDVWHLRTQAVAIALVLACGVALFVAMRTTMRSLEQAQAAWYAQSRFAHAFVRVVRAPEHVAARLRAIPGVQRVQTRVVADVTLDVANAREAITGRLVSLPDRGRPEACDLRLRSGRMPIAGRADEVVVNEAFAEAHGLRPGAELGALVQGRALRLRAVGTVSSPEYAYAVGPGQLFPDDRRFGVLWLPRAVLAPAVDMAGAFNDAVFQLAPDARLPAVLAQLDLCLERWGGLGAIARRDQPSHFFVQNELQQLSTFTWFVPVLFLAVAAFLLQIVAGRMVAGQRDQIATLKAVGYRDREVGRHYAGIVAVVVAGGFLLGSAGGAWLGRLLVGMYSRFFRFPELPYAIGVADVALAAAVTGGAAALGVGTIIAHVMRLPPAEAMRPPAPPVYRPTLLERLGWARLVPLAARMVLREVERRPGRASLSVLGVACATALVVVGSFGNDSVRRLMNVQFELIQRAGATVTLAEPRDLGALAELRALPGVRHVEPFRTVPARLRHGARARTAVITGVPRDATMHQLLDVELRRLEVPAAGLVLARKLAHALGVAAGDELVVEVLDGARPTQRVRVARVVETFVGVDAYQELGALCRTLGETGSLSGAWLAVHAHLLDELHEAVKRTPAIAGIDVRDAGLRSLRRILDEHIGTSTAVTLGFSLVMAFGVLFNTARITVAERARELTSLRVLGFRGREVAAVLIGEIVLLVGLAVPPGLLLGRGLAAAIATSPGFDNEQFRLPLVVAPSTYALAVAVVLAATAASAWLAWRRLDRLELVAVLKARD
jgi:putative ABC transport system permease protein